MISSQKLLQPGVRVRDALDRKEANMRPTQKIAAEQARRRRNAFHLHIDLSGLLAVMVVLLFILMFAHPGAHSYTHLPVDLPTADHAVSQPGAQADDKLRVSVTRDGSVYVGTSRVLPDQLSGLIRDAVRGGAERKVYLAADARAKYGDVDRVVEQIRRAGIGNVTFLAYQTKKP
jgi:biopolymer transport protein ExbD